jgi:hypothetical protein
MPLRHRYFRKDELTMAQDRITLCKFYICKGECSKGRDSDHNGYCQKCNKYEPRCKVKIINRKKEKLEKIRLREW